MPFNLTLAYHKGLLLMLHLVRNSIPGHPRAAKSAPTIHSYVKKKRGGLSVIAVKTTAEPVTCMMEPGICNAEG